MCTSKNLFFGFTSSKRHLLPSLKMLHSNKEQYWTISRIFFEKNLEIMENVSWAWKKIIKYFVKNSFSVFGGVPLTPQTHTKTLFVKMFYNFFCHAQEKYIFYHFQKKWHDSLLILVFDVFCYCKEF